ncbi:hypothetical protein Gohar_024057 [Gossypium harknessii]|uniref:VQ domain-containing protein n=1 Tax=Gossypium harknessii TaxID=34285 RepID=A0A7J9HEQ5_9ROSI|nr:hypothetical protein [Gossypium harknessii]
MSACTYPYTGVADAFVVEARACKRVLCFASDMGLDGLAPSAMRICCQALKIGEANAPPIIKKSSFDHTQALPPPQLQQSHPSQPHPQPQNPNQSGLQAQQNQPPVYNINKNDFRDVVQKLTGSPAQERYSTSPPPIHQPKPQSSQLQRIRPPPLAYVSNRPMGLMIKNAVPNMNPPACSLPTLPISGPIGNSFIQRPPAATPLSPLPPFPVVHAAAESPVSAYLRYFQNSMPSTVDSIPK